jgi:hypothetical protein
LNIEKANVCRDEYVVDAGATASLGENGRCHVRQPVR